MLPLLPILICFLWIGFYGLDFGTHWDEPSAKFASVKATLQTGVFLQGAEGIFAATYNYGGVNYLLTWAGLRPRGQPLPHPRSFSLEKPCPQLFPPSFTSIPFECECEESIWCSARFRSFGCIGFA
jgi:hypothetical protein